MSLNESIVEDAALEWFHLRRALRDYGGQVGDQPFRRLRRATPTLAPCIPSAERDSFSEVVLVGLLREAIRRLNFFI
jgi:type I restriction enzyme R subunit